ncbi:LPXTG cell wall anchor domain-containing protein [Aeromicrobium piscarium]|uniref:LPXTG cell wall anchor domain-containing protein n=1 Tax=Aeromicrobium piscarium TaxID=2590901 RepID=UPI00163D43D6|nr:LPXTG cell wall anchor domain-containing protein [Aeromicrobium piscarium]
MTILLVASALIGGALPASAAAAPVSMGGAELPGTGTQVGLLAILGALALLALGLVVLLLARRNRH